MTEKHRPDLVDYLVTALSPALIMAMIGCLVFFLVEILYGGRYEGRLLWTLFFFVIGIVLVARISIEISATQAAVYGLGLALVSWLALQAFIQYPDDSPASPFAGLINLFLMGVVWWSAHRLTWDCTFIDEQRKSSTRGLLSAAGFEHLPGSRGQTRSGDGDDGLPKINKKASFFERWNRYREYRKNRPHTPGLSVVWFSLAALPIFGLGESFIPPGDTARRGFCFWLAAGYVGSGLGLLLTTSFLGLRRYLRQRKMPMPGAMTYVWLGGGSALVIAFVLISALLPRPYSETPIWDLKRVSSRDRDASRNAVLGGESGKSSDQRDIKERSDRGEAMEPGSGKHGHNSGQPKGDGKDGKELRGKGDGQQQNGDKGSDGKGGGEEDGSAKADSAAKSGPDAGKRSGDRSWFRRQTGSDRKQHSDTENTAAEKGVESVQTPTSPVSQALAGLLNFFKWFVFAIVALAILAILLIFGLRYLAGFMPGARRLLAELLQWWNRRQRKIRPVRAAAEAAARKPKPRPPFTAFRNPFADGSAEGRPVEELIEYSFAALEAWAADRDHGRTPDETPLEFAARLNNTFAALEGEARSLAILVVRLAYANGTLPADSRDTLDRFWDVVTSFATPTRV